VKGDGVGVGGGDRGGGRGMRHDVLNNRCCGSVDSDLESEFGLFVHGADEDADAVPTTQLIQDIRVNIVISLIVAAKYMITRREVYLIQHDEAGTDGRGVQPTHPPEI
jgi:hypothetical protein